MSVKLISISTPSEEMLTNGVNTPEELIAFCARVSNPQNQLNKATSGQLIEYLIKHKHWSPFEMVSMCVEINATRDISRQILRHRSFSFQEFSQRYQDVRYLNHSTKDARMQDSNNRQNSILTTDAELIHWWQEAQEHVWEVAEDIYTQALRRGLAKEVARAVLPEGMAMSRLHMHGTIRSWIHYLEVRMGVETQLEHLLIANQIAEILEKNVPIIYRKVLNG